MSEYKDLKREFNSKSFKTMLKKQLGCVCANCKSKEGIEYHHIVPLSLGGTNNITNIAPLCYECHKKAHVSRYIHKVFKPEKTGRPRTPLPDNYENTLWKYFHGEIGRKECEDSLGLGKASKLTDRLFFKEFVKKHEIVSFVNMVDTFKKFPSKAQHGEILAKVVFADGKEDIRYIA